jgi:hypothetical protein
MSLLSSISLDIKNTSSEREKVSMRALLNFTDCKTQSTFPFQPLRTGLKVIVGYHLNIKIMVLSTDGINHEFMMSSCPGYAFYLK